jgi:hypothetical protein
MPVKIPPWDRQRDK